MNSSQTSQETAPSSAGIVRRVFNRIFGRHTLNAALLVCLVAELMGLLINPGELIKDPDVWWHLSDARILLTTHHFIRVDPYSFTVAGARWVNFEWLSELPYWLAYSWRGWQGLHLLAIAVFCANLIFIYFRSFWKSRHYGAAVWASIVIVPLLGINFGARTIAIAYLAFSAEMAILEAAERGHARLLWLLPPLFCLWINLHGSWMIGLALLALYLISGIFPVSLGVFEQSAFSPAERNRLLKVFAASVAVLMLNPYGWRLVWFPIDFLMSQGSQVALTDEWQPLNLGTFLGKMVVIAILLMIAASCVRGRKWKLYEMGFILFAWYAAFSHQRFAFMAAVIVTPWLAGDIARSFMGPTKEKTIPAVNAVFVAIIAAVFIFLTPSEARLEKAMRQAKPYSIVSAIQPSWRTYNDHSLGGMMDFYSKPTFVDSRNDIFVHQGVFKDYLAIASLQNPFELLARYRIDHVLIRAGSPLAFTLERDSGWRVAICEGSGEYSYELFAKMAGARAAASAPSSSGR